MCVENIASGVPDVVAYGRPERDAASGPMESPEADTKLSQCPPNTGASA